MDTAGAPVASHKIQLHSRLISHCFRDIDPSASISHGHRSLDVCMDAIAILVSVPRFCSAQLLDSNFSPTALPTDTRYADSFLCGTLILRVMVGDLHNTSWPC